MSGAPLGTFAWGVIGDMSDGNVLGVPLLLPTKKLRVIIDLKQSLGSNCAVCHNGRRHDYRI